MVDLLRGPELTDRYTELAAKVDAFHGRVLQQHPGALACRSGCSACCHQHLTVVPLEFRRIAAAVLGLDAAEQDALRERLAMGRDDPRCPLLDDHGRCRTYDARPLICRSHGLPIQVQGRRDVCPLNFTDGPRVEALAAEVVFNVDSANAILAVMSSLEGDDPIARVDLINGVKSLLEAAAQGAVKT